MNRGYLSGYFTGAAVKILSEVEANPGKSNQHEFSTTREMRKFLGDSKQTFPTRFIWLGDEQESVSDAGFTTLYDTREYDPKRSAEWRIYYNSNDVTSMMQPGETLFVAMRPDRTLLVIITESDGTLRNQLLWLFGFDSQPGLKFNAQIIEKDDLGALDFAARFVLDEIGIEYEDPEANTLDSIIEKYGTTFPKTREFSALARQTVSGVNVREQPDETLVAWLDHEEALFRRLERRVVAERLETGFAEGGEIDVDGFLHFSLSVQNRRKSRMGLAFENQLEAVFRNVDMDFTTQAITENGNKPDFLFPSLSSYSDPGFPADRLAMLGAKSTCKERWRQILPEADRITIKHLATLEPGISEKQTGQMEASNVRLVVPLPIHKTYSQHQQSWLMSIADFISHARNLI